jgi:hypothetical protein
MSLAAPLFLLFLLGPQHHPKEQNLPGSCPPALALLAGPSGMGAWSETQCWVRSLTWFPSLPILSTMAPWMPHLYVQGSPTVKQRALLALSHSIVPLEHVTLLLSPQLFPGFLLGLALRCQGDLLQTI